MARAAQGKMMLESLKEEIIADAFEKRWIVGGKLAERLIRERQWAADEIERLRAENERLLAAAQTGFSWMSDLEHVGSIADQERLAVDLAKVIEAVGLERLNQQTASTCHVCGMPAVGQCEKSDDPSDPRHRVIVGLS